MEKDTVLIVDDEVQYLDAISNLLPSEQFSILRAVNGEMAFHVAKKRLPDIIIMDWDMPVLTGIEATKKLKRDRNTAHIPVIMSTGVMTSAEDLQIALSAGAIDYIRKPVGQLELLARMNSALTIAYSFRKIQNQKKLLEDQKKSLERSNLTKERLLAIVAHDLNSPLSSLKGTLGLIRIRAKDEGMSYNDLIDLFNHIEDEFQSVVELMNSLLLWALDQQQALNFNPVRFRIDEVVEPCFRLIAGQVENKHLKIDKDYNSAIDLYTDKDMLEFIIRNLLANAVKFTPAGGKIRLSVTTSEDGVLCAVEDSGVGMTTSQLAVLFDQIDPQKSQNDTYGKKGTGLGLAMSKEFAQKMRATIWAESEKGQGSAFYLKLPISTLVATS